VCVLILFYIDLLLIIAFFTLFERKIMAGFHIRKGPNKVSYWGLLQPLVDAIKLLSKQKYDPVHSNKFIFNIAPSVALVISLFIWHFLPFIITRANYSISLAWYLVISRVIVFFNMISGWSSNNKYSLIGILRGAATTIRYEASFIFSVLFLCLLYHTFDISSFYEHEDYLVLVIFPFIFIRILAELHRTPFDFSESESELVSGYNTEYSGKDFAYLFLGEYSMLLFNCILISILFFGSTNMFLLCISTLILRLLFVNIRITLCRYRYDLLIIFNWKVLLPIILIIVILLSFV